jgi:hypothetical protein
MIYDVEVEAKRMDDLDAAYMMGYHSRDESFQRLRDDISALKKKVLELRQAVSALNGDPTNSL